MSFAVNIKKVLTDKHISQKDLAAGIHKTRSAVSLYCSGKVIPSESVLADICNYLHISKDDLIQDDVITKSNNVSVAECAKLLGKSQQFVRIGLQTGSLDIGFAVKRKSKFSYYISRKKLNEYIGGD